MTETRRAWIEGITLFAITAALIVAAARIETTGLYSGSVTSTITTVVLLYVPIGWILFRKWDLKTFGITLDGWAQALKILSLFALATLPIFYIGNHLLETLVYEHTFQFRLPEEFSMLVLTEVLAVSLPEEFFYRGYLQSRFEQGSKPRFRLLGVQFGWGMIVAAVLFVLAHTLVSPQLWHVGIIAPALAFGWLRAKTGSLVAPILYHAVCNLSMNIAQASYV